MKKWFNNYELFAIVIIRKIFPAGNMEEAIRLKPKFIFAALALDQEGSKEF